MINEYRFRKLNHFLLFLLLKFSIKISEFSDMKVKISEQNIQNIQPFVSYFFELKKDAKALGFVNSKELSYCHTPKLQYDFFYQKDLNWYYKPESYIIDNFVKKEYDILINLCDSNVIPIKYLVAKSIARFKIGIHEENFEIYDLMISLNKNATIHKLMKEIKHYINLINR